MYDHSIQTRDRAKLRQVGADDCNLKPADILAGLVREGPLMNELS